MIKKLTLLALSAAALVAFAVPAAAQASVAITDETGAEAQTVTGMSENTVSTTSTGTTLECDTVNLHLTRTSTGHYSGTGSAVGGATVAHAGACKSSAGFHVHITSITATVTNEGNGKGSADFTYTYQLTTPFGTLNCDFAAKGASVSSEGSNISVSGTMTGSGAGCPGGGTIKGDFAVSDEFGGSVVIH